MHAQNRALRLVDVKGQPGVDADEFQAVLGRDGHAFRRVQQDVDRQAAAEQQEGQQQEGALGRQQAAALDEGVGHAGEAVGPQNNLLGKGAVSLTLKVLHFEGCKPLVEKVFYETAIV